MKSLIYTPELEERIARWAKERIAPNRIPHVTGVVETADRLALRYTRNQVGLARLAGWIHDAAKHWPETDLLDYAQANGLTITEDEERMPMLLHGAVGYALASEVFGFEDRALQSACANHTTGAPEMTTLDKVVYVADLIEPNRVFKGVDALRDEAERDLDAAMLRSLDFTIQHLINRCRYIDMRALQTRNRLIEQGVRYSP